jgi:hypothetical protein
MSGRIRKTHSKVWENILSSISKEELSLLSIGSMKEAKEIVGAFFVPDKIHPLNFYYNCEALLLEGMPSLGVIASPEKSPQPTSSLSRFVPVIDRPLGVPLWFIAAYPDVLLWYDNEVGEYMKAHRPDRDSLTVFSANLFGLDPTDPNLEKKLNDSKDKEDKLRPNILRNLVQSYKDKASRELETAVKTPADDVYLGSEILEAFGVENNFILIAVNTTKYYLELARGYRDRFRTEVALLATTGVLDAQYYIMEQTVRPSEILEMAEGAAVHAEGALLDFIVRLEMKLFMVDNPDMDISDIEMACLAQKAEIADAIKRIKNEYVSEPMFASNVSEFMNSHQYRALRQALGVES